MEFLWYAKRFQCNAMGFVCHAMRNWNKWLNDTECFAMLWHAMRLEQQHFHIQESFTHLEV